QPVVAVELWAGDRAVDRVVYDDERTGQTARLTWTPDATGTVTLAARAITADGAVGQSNPVRIEVVEELPLAGLEAHITAAGDTLEAIAERAGVDVDLLAGVNPDVTPGPDGTVPEGTT